MKRTPIILVLTVFAASIFYIILRNYRDQPLRESKQTTVSHSEDKIVHHNAKKCLMCERAHSSENIDSSAKVVDQSMAKTGDYIRCPVSGVVFLIKDEKNKLRYGGKTAYTCCATCAKIFMESPDYFIEKIN